MESTVYRRNRDGSIEIVQPGDPAHPNTPKRSAVNQVQSQSVTQDEPQVLPTPAQPKPQKPQKVKKQKRRFLPRKVSWTLRIALALYLIAFIWVGTDLSGGLQRVQALPPQQIAKTEGTNWLLVGTDSRQGLTEAEQRALHTGTSVGQRSDTIMIVHLGSDKPTIISLPRDSWVALPRHRSTDGTIRGEYNNKINASFSIGGPELLVRTIERNTGLHIDHFMMIGFLGIRNLTDAVGGVRLCPKHNYNDKSSGLHIYKGCRVVNGKTALAYVRMRHADPEGDIGRIKRQQEFVSAVLHKVLSPSVILNPFAVRSLGQAAESVLTVGQNESLTDLASFALAMRTVAKGGGKTVTVPLVTSHGWRNGQSVVIWDKAKAHRLFKTLGAK